MRERNTSRLILNFGKKLRDNEKGGDSSNMRYLAVVNYEQLDSITFFVANLYDDNGYLADQIITPKTTDDDAIIKIRELALLYDTTNLEVWTSTKSLYKKLLQEAGMAASLEERSATLDTLRAINEHSDLLHEFYFLDKLPKSKLKKLGGLIECIKKKLSKHKN
ncbi:hypothetical protein [Fervidibacillus halotolerans]|uniref:Uncharacterized protein n=1 Tax=Fervidibacillus halotolerans TaxID=2980027 RepID=A0A9E8M1E2_9BACI|nr:hypothetical protein [Fervidibacillus halotolerans]WAA13401.1 hypothetical protein OE105_04620 [Fervidibacillus halotolerans]